MAEQANDRLPPQSREAECSVLGSMLRDNEVIDDVVQIIREQHFYTDAHQKIYRGILHLHEKRTPIDAVTLAQWLIEQKFMEDIGGYAYLAELWDAAPTAANAEYYARIVRDKGLVRQLIHTSTEVLRDAYDQSGPADELLAQAERKVFEIAQLGVVGQHVTLHTALNEAFNRLDQRISHGRPISGVSTGYIDLDEITAGLQNSELIIVAARPSVGKTSFALNVVRNMITKDKVPTLFVSLEQSRTELAERLLCCHAQVDSHRLRQGHLSADDILKLSQAGDELRDAPLYIDDTPSQGMIRIAANARRLMRKGLKAVFIDYLQLIEPDSRGGRESRQEQVASISRRLKFLARELQIPVVAMAQLNRSPEERQDHKPRLSDLRESGSIEQDADTVMMLHRPEQNEPGKQEGAIDVIVAKQRNGPTGEKSLAFIKQFMRFDNFAVEAPFGYGGE
ncbi:MAG TPA: replicative DNA helicase [Gemmataceae bacterium]|nr:replicative DNA helicase [Gemmataceae bacterium]